MCRKLILFFLIILSGITNIVVSQTHLSFYHITMDKGLSNNTTYSTLMCKRGFIWIATETGLNRFDGYNFRVYTNDAYNPRSLSSNRVRNMVEDSLGNIWIANLSGVSKYNWETDDFTVFLHDPQNPMSIIDNTPQNIGIDSKQRIWILTLHGISILDDQNDTIKHLVPESENPNSLVSETAVWFMEDNQERFWIATRNGLSIYDEKRNRFTNFRAGSNTSSGLITDRLSTVFQDSKGRIWIGSYSGLMLWNETTRSFKHYVNEPGNPSSIVNNQINSITESQSGNLWIGTSGGLARYNEREDNFTNVLRSAYDPESLSNNDINHVYFDAYNIMWVSTRYGGVSVFDPGLKKFTHYRNNPMNAKSLADNNVTSFAEDSNGNIWVGVDGGGLNYLNRSSNSFTRYLAKGRMSNWLPNNKVLALMADSRGNVWIGMWGAGLSMYNPRNNTFRNFRHDPNNQNSLLENNVFYIYEDINGEIWVAEWSGGVSIYNYETNSFRRIYPMTDPDGLPASATNHITRDSNDNIWLVHESGGMSRYDRENSECIRYTSTTHPVLMENEAIYCFHEDITGRYWLGTAYGIVLFDPISNNHKVYTTQDGLTNNNVLGILEDDEGYLWLSTYNGLSRFDPDNLSFRNYETADGLQGNQFNRWAFKRLSSGELLFGGVNGFNIFNPAEMSDNPNIPLIYIVDFKLFNEEVPIGPNSILSENTITSNSITLRHWQNVITFEFAALNFRHPERNQYRYMLEGFNDNWINLRNERQVSFTNLNPGRYTLRIIASNNDGLWNEVGTSLAIRVIPPFWLTWWFIGLCILFIASIIWLFIKQREKALLREKEVMQEHIKISQKTALFKQNFLANMSHEIRTPLTGVLGMLEILKQTSLDEPQKDYLQTLEASGKHLKQIIDQVLDYSKIEAGKVQINPTVFSLNHLIKQSLMLYENTLNPGVKTKYFIDPQIPVFIEADEFRLSQIVNNLVSNAVKFTHKGLISINCMHIAMGNLQKKGTIRVEITDTGPGIPDHLHEYLFTPFSQIEATDIRKYDGTGLGLSICRELIKLIGGELGFNSEPGKGSTFWFTFPASIAEKQPISDVQYADTPSQKNLHILLAEDKIVNQKVIKLMLSSLGHELHIVCNGQVALDQFEPGKFDLILMDIQMPVMDGVTATQKLKERYNDLPPIVGLSANAFEGDREKYMARGMDDYLTKPVKKGDFEELIKKLIA
jgi:signal transduction histidine kinase/ligand-binding sensor domain-containing protein/CheY-like chemotaxis protein